ncbi:MAG: asparagine synthase (glutamine-hydrolyzing), partial [Rhodospirillales bacterium]
MASISHWQRRRGPDDHDTWRSPDRLCLLDHRRLAIIDLSPGGRQPMLSADGNLAITFNGEIYNYRELRRQLQEEGCVFRSSSDTEVILQLYDRCGEAAIARLRGMFALAIWDRRKNGVLLARDPFGIKPLYYADSHGTLRFASSARALIAGKNVATDIDPAGQAGFLMMGSVPEPFTWWRAISALPAGTTLWLTRDGVGKPKRYVDVASYFATDKHRAIDVDFATSFAETVRCHMIADVPVGVFLSSGLDSVAIAEKARLVSGRPLITLTVGFDVYRDTPEDETEVAARAAKILGADHHQENIGVKDFRDHRDAMLTAMDQPTIDGLNTYFVALAAKRAGLKVALSGVGGDELLGGYPSFSQIPMLVGIVSRIPWLSTAGRGVRSILAPLIGHVTSPKYAGLLEYGGTYADAYRLRRGLFMPWELPTVMNRNAAVEGLERLAPLWDEASATTSQLEPYSAVAWLELTLYLRNQLLRDTDWASMRHSLEIRTPFVDIELVRQIAPQLSSPARPDKKTLMAGMSTELRALLQN